jgi:hypothetical protein
MVFMSKRKNEIIAGEMKGIPLVVSFDPDRKEGEK